MAITISSTNKSASTGIKCLVYGQSGAGKTYLTSTLPGKTLILSAEAGLLSLAGYDIPSITISSPDDLIEAYQYVSGKDGDAYNNIVLDSISEIGEQILTFEMSNPKHKGNGMAAYGELATRIIAMTKAFRDLQGKNVVFIAKAERSKDEGSGMVLMQPALPGNKATVNMPYLFDLVMYLRCDKDAEGKITRSLQTTGDYQILAKDRSGVLDVHEPANLGAIFNKINKSSKGAKA